jgi:rhodanese-related sulfurtransferase
MLREALLLIALSLVGAVGTHFFHPRAPAWYLVEAPLAEDEVSMAVIAEKWNSDVFWIDARIAEQFNQEHVPGAVSLNEQNFDQALFEQIATLQDLKKPVIIYCGSEKCDASRKIKEQLLQRVPLENVFILKGGWQAWQQAQKK